MKALSNWKGTISINDKVVDNSFNFDALKGRTVIKLFPGKKVDKVERKTVSVDFSENSGLHKITVKKYMTRKATPEFNFMSQWNEDVPMPLLTMIGTIEKETPGMVYMNLHGDITERVTNTCLCCGKPITNPVSKYFGMGPVCGNHNYVNPFNSEEELNNAVNAYREQLKNITWSGWMPKSAIVSDTIL